MVMSTSTLMVLLMSSRTLMVLMSLIPTRTLMLLQLLPLLQLFLSRMGNDPTASVVADCYVVDIDVELGV